MAKKTHPPTFVEVIRAFDSHERGILFKWAAGEPFKISAELRSELSKKLERSLPAEPFVAMDYTLDWLHAALTCFLIPEAWEESQPIQLETIKGSQEDIDLLICWADPAPHLVLVEAKGFTGWSNDQMASKAKRLGAILNESVRATVDSHFVLAGPEPSVGLRRDNWPGWMQGGGSIHFLHIPDPGPRWQVQRHKLNVTSEEEHVPPSWTMWRPILRCWR